jgi:hypothetical protein
MTREEIDDDIKTEQARGVNLYGEYHSMHEAYAVIKEEFEEFWDSIKRNEPDPEELIQVIATARRALCEYYERGLR